MAKNSKIEWTHHTFNPWWGCAKVSPACKNCYAEAWAKRTGSDVWGARAPRRFFTDRHWAEPLAWNRDAERNGERRRVFCASMADVFERRADLKEARSRLWRLIGQTPNLDWLLLTKRPHNISTMAPWGHNQWPDNIWLGTTVENQHWAEERIPELGKHPARVRFLSCEPLLGELDLTPYFAKGLIDWVIAGGESGARSRPMSPRWVRKLRDDCVRHQVAFHFKQWGHWAPAELLTTDQKNTLIFEEHRMAAAGKKQAGRSLDGEIWDQLPRSA